MTGYAFLADFPGFRHVGLNAARDHRGEASTAATTLNKHDQRHAASKNRPLSDIVGFFPRFFPG
jgi:hypothetical protein